MEYMLNELSLSTVQTKMQVYGLMENFVHAAVYAEELLGLTCLRMDESIGQNLYEVYFMRGYSVGTWLGDNQVDKDLKDKFLTITSSSPLIVDEDLKSRFDDENCFYENNLGLGIKAALIYDSLCVNFLCKECWNASSLPVRHEYIENEEIKSNRTNVKCFANRFHIQSHHAWIQQKQKQEVKNGEDLWQKKEIFFSNLFFCDRVKQNLLKVGYSTDLMNIIDRLKTLDSIAREWKEGDFNYEVINRTKNITIHPETQLTLDNYGTMRCFRLPDGTRKVFSFHIITGSLRIYFYPNDELHEIYVGYIGPHLRTWLY